MKPRGVSTRIDEARRNAARERAAAGNKSPTSLKRQGNGGCRRAVVVVCAAFACLTYLSTLGLLARTERAKRVVVEAAERLEAHHHHRRWSPSPSPMPSPTPSPTPRPSRGESKEQPPTPRPSREATREQRVVAVETRSPKEEQQQQRVVVEEDGLLVLIAGLPRSGADALAASLGGAGPIIDWDSAGELLSRKQKMILRLPGAPPNAMTGGQIFANLALRSSVKVPPKKVIVLRHPLAWAVAFATRSDPVVPVGKIEVGVGFWINAATELLEGCDDCIVVHAETLGEGDGLGAQLLQRLGVNKEMVLRTGVSIESNLELVRCWIRGRAWSQERCEFRGDLDEQFLDGKKEESNYTQLTLDAKEVHREISSTRHIEFWRIKRELECSMEPLGYSMRSFEFILACSKSCGHGIKEALRARPVMHELTAPALFERSLHNDTTKGQHKGDVIIVFFKVYLDVRGGGRGGMFTRMSQVAQAVVDAGYNLHFICHCNMPNIYNIDTGWAPPGTHFYPGTMMQQLDQMLPYSCGLDSVAALFLFVTSLTVDQHYRATVKRARLWWKEPPMGGLDSERIARRVSEHSPLVKRIVLTDDVHHIRATEAFRDVGDDLHVDYMIEWLKRREMAIYREADAVLTVSNEDAAYISKELAWMIIFKRRRQPRVSWAPFLKTEFEDLADVNGTTVNITSDIRTYMSDVSNRSALLYVGMPHPLAIPAVEWLVRLLPRICEILKEQFGMPQSFVDRHCMLYLVGGGHPRRARRWQQLKDEAPLGAQKYVTLVGAISDFGITKYLTKWRRVFVAPLFNNTGIATKVVNAMSHGLPVVTTKGGIRGLGFESEAEIADNLLVADDAEGFAQEAARLLVDDALWRKLSENSLSYVEDKFSKSALTEVVQSTMAERKEAVEVDAQNATLSYLPTLELASSTERVLTELELCATERFPQVSGPSIVGRFFVARRFRAPKEASVEISESQLVAGVLGESCIPLEDPFSPSKGFRSCSKGGGVDAANLRTKLLDEPRLFEWAGDFWVIFVATPHCFSEVEKCAWCENKELQYLVKLGGKNAPFWGPVLPLQVTGTALGAVQRAFVPFVVGGDLYASWFLEPHVVLRINVTTVTPEGHAVPQAVEVAATSKDTLWQDLRQLDGGCQTKPAILGATPAIRVDNYYLGILRTYVERGCVRFYEHYAYAFAAEPPFRMLRRSRLPLPLSVRSFAHAGTSECVLADSWRVRSLRAKLVAGLELNEHGTVAKISYSAGAQYTPMATEIVLDELDMVDMASPIADLLVSCDGSTAPECKLIESVGACPKAPAHQRRR